MQGIRPYVYRRPRPMYTANQRELTTSPNPNYFRTLPFHAQFTKILKNKQSHIAWVLTAPPHSELKTSKKDETFEDMYYFIRYLVKKRIYPKMLLSFCNRFKDVQLRWKMETRMEKLRKYKCLSLNLLEVEGLITVEKDTTSEKCPWFWIMYHQWLHIDFKFYVFLLEKS